MENSNITKEEQLLEELLRDVTNDECFQEFSLKLLEDAVWSGEVHYNQEEVDKLIEKMKQRYGKGKI